MTSTDSDAVPPTAHGDLPPQQPGSGTPGVDAARAGAGPSDSERPPSEPGREDLESSTAEGRTVEEGDGGVRAEKAFRGVRGESVDEQIRAKNAFVGTNTFTGTVNFNQTQYSYRAVDWTARARELADDYVSPPQQDLLVHSVGEGATVLYGKREMGKLSAALVALHAAAKSPVFQVASELRLERMEEALRDLAEKHPDAGVVIDDVSAELLSQCSTFHAKQLEEFLNRGDACVGLILVSHVDSIVSDVAETLITVRAEHPPAAAVLEHLLRSMSVPSELDSRARRVAGLLGTGGHGFKRIRTLLSLLQEFPTDTDEQLLDRLHQGSGATMLAEWRSTEPDVDSYAVLLAASACEGAPYWDVMRHAENLAAAYRDAQSKDAVAPPVFKPDTSTSSLLQPVRRRFNTAIGPQNERVLELKEPLGQFEVLEHLWEHAGYRMRSAILAWLDHLASLTDDIDAAFGAAVFAGVLLGLDPGYIEHRLLTPWAWLSTHHARIAGTALGVPAVRNEDCSSVRALAHRWARTHDREMQVAAVAAYGGPLGAWDPSTNSVEFLWRLHRTNTTLAREIAAGLAQLTVAGAAAKRSRDDVLMFLWSKHSQSPRHANDLRYFTAVVVRYLTSSPRNCVESFGSLRRDERGSRSNLLKLVAWSSVSGSTAICLSIYADLVAAVAARRLAHNDLVDLLRLLKDEARNLGLLPQLASRLRSSLTRLARPSIKTEIAWEANALLRQFFNTGGHRTNEQHNQVRH